MQNVADYPTFYMDHVMQALHRHQGDALEVVNLCQAGSSFNPFDHLDVQFTAADLAEHRPYAGVQGSLTLRRQLCYYLEEKFQVSVAPEQICLTAGATEALAVALGMVAQPGGEVLLAETHFPPFRSTVHMFGMQCRTVPTNGHKCIDVTQLSRYISAQTRAIIINSPSNPHGAVLSAAELATIADFGVPVIFDEVYQALALTASVIPSAIDYCNEHVIINSFSKSLSLAGMRIGYMVVPPAQVTKMLDVKATLTFSTNSLAQTIVERLLPHWDRLIVAHRQELSERWLYFEQSAVATGLTLLERPQAGLYGLVDLSKYKRSSAQIAMELATDFAVGTAPSIDFHYPDPKFLRINFASKPHLVEHGLCRIAQYLQNCQKQSSFHCTR